MSKIKTPLNDTKEAIEKNFLEENQDTPIDQKVVIAKEVPSMEWITFVNNRDTGVTLHFHYASATHPIKHYDLVHGQKYCLPVEVINHLHGEIPYDLHSCHERIHGIRKDLEGINQSYIKDYKQLYICKPCRM
jgi:hypothetical protein